MRYVFIISFFQSRPDWGWCICRGLTDPEPAHEKSQGLSMKNLVCEHEVDIERRFETPESISTQGISPSPTDILIKTHRRCNRFSSSLYNGNGITKTRTPTTPLIQQKSHLMEWKVAKQLLLLGNSKITSVKSSSITCL